MINGWERVRIVRYILGGEELGDGYCDEHCDNCEVKFQCYTTTHEVLIMSKLTPERFRLIQPYFLALKECKVMRCPHCQELFKVTYDQLQNNTKFRCRTCGRYNWGSCEADEYGILIGEIWEKDFGISNSKKSTLL